MESAKLCALHGLVPYGLIHHEHHDLRALHAIVSLVPHLFHVSRALHTLMLPCVSCIVLLSHASSGLDFLTI